MDLAEESHESDYSKRKMGGIVRIYLRRVQAVIVEYGLAQSYNSWSTPDRWQLYRIQLGHFDRGGSDQGVTPLIRTKHRIQGVK